MLGTAVGHYRLVRLLGRGGMGTVYLAVHPKIGSQVAVKVLHAAKPRGGSDRADDGGASGRRPPSAGAGAAAPVDVSSATALSDETPGGTGAEYQRFLLEAQAVNRIRHPNIIRIMDLDTLPDGRPYVLMELLQGHSLKERMTGKGGAPSLGPAEANRVVQDVLSALQAAHDAEFVHRDLKPDNIFVTDEGPAKLLDFGIAKLVDSSDQTALTQSGAIVGTPQYLSPEQAVGDQGRIGPWTDLYALGVILYELVTGRSPFAGRSVGQLLIDHVQTAPPPPSTVCDAVPPALERVILRCLEKEPEKRPQSAAELREAWNAAYPEYASALLEVAAGATMPRLTRTQASGAGAGSDAQASRPTGGLSGTARGEAVGGRPAPDAGAGTRATALVGPGPDRGHPAAWRRFVGPALLVALLGAVGLLLWERYGPARESARSREAQGPPGAGAGMDTGAGSGSGSGSGMGMGMGMGAGAGTTPTGPAGPRRPGVAAAEGTLVVLHPARALSLDPSTVARVEEIDVQAQTHEALVRFDPLVGQVRPCLATSWIRQGNTWRFRLRPNVRFQDGTPLNGRTAAQALRRSVRSAIGSMDFADVKRVHVTGPDEVALDVAGDSGSLLIRLSLASARLGLPGKPYPVGTGPFRVVSWNQRVGAVILAPNASYWGPAPRLARVIFRGEPDASTRATLLRQGEAQIIRNLPTHIAHELERRPEIRVVRSSQSFTAYLTFDTRKPYLADAAVRRALSLAVDRQRLVKELYHGSAELAVSSTPRQLVSSRVLADVRADPAAAKRRLVAAGITRRTLSLCVYEETRPYSPDPKLFARLMSEMLRGAGVTVQPKIIPYTRMKVMVRGGECDLALFGWSLDYPDPENVYYLLSASANRAGYNYAHYADPAFEALLARAKAEPDLDRRRKRFDEVEAHVVQQRPWFPLVYVASYLAHQSTVQGARFNVSGTFTLDLHQAFLKRP